MKYISLYAPGSEQYEDKRQEILKGIKEKTNEKQDKLKTELKEELKNEVNEENLDNDDFFEIEGKPKKKEPKSIPVIDDIKEGQSKQKNKQKLKDKFSEKKGMSKKRQRPEKDFRPVIIFIHIEK